MTEKGWGISNLASSPGGIGVGGEVIPKHIPPCLLQFPSCPNTCLMPHCVLDRFPSPSNFLSPCPCFPNKPCTFTSSSQVCSREKRPQYPPMLLYSFYVIKISFFFFFFKGMTYISCLPLTAVPAICSHQGSSSKEWCLTLTHADAPRCRLFPECAVTAPARGSLFITRTHPVNRKTS